MNYRYRRYFIIIFIVGFSPFCTLKPTASLALRTTSIRLASPAKIKSKIIDKTQKEISDSSTQAKRYNEHCYLVAHNAFASKASGWWYRQQNWSIMEMLDNGVRGLMLDIYPIQKDIYLCHGECSTWYTLQKGLWRTVKSLFSREQPYEKLDKVLKEIAKWVKEKNSKQEIITLFFENYADDDKLNAILSKTFGELIFTPKDLKDNDNTWPLVNVLEIEADKKRVICFNEKKAGLVFPSDQEPLFFSSYDYIIESQYGSTKLKDVCMQRKESKEALGEDFIETRPLFLFNYFRTPSFEAYAKKNNKKEAILKKLTRCQSYNRGDLEPIIPVGLKPNFIALDFVDHGEGLAAVEEINQYDTMQKLADEFKRKSDEKLKQPSLLSKTYEAARNIFRKRPAGLAS